MKSIIAIDPGASGGIAWRDNDGTVYSCNMPPTFTEIADVLVQFKLTLNNPSCVIEKVGG